MPDLHPPRIALALTAGVTGHRHAALDGVRAPVDRLLAALARSVARVAGTHIDCFAAAPPRLRLVSALAAGADALVAEAGIGSGFGLLAVLPLPRADYAADFDGDAARARFETLLGQAETVLELPAETDRPAAYAMAGRAVVAHSDLLIAVWDGDRARGRGGTADVVAHALRRGVPVVHLDPQAARPARLIWRGLDGFVAHEAIEDVPAVPLDDAALDRVVDAILAPPPPERGFLADYLAERERTVRTRIEYPLLLALTGIKRLRASHVRARRYLAAAHEEWSSFHAGHRAHGVAATLDPVREAYAWSDRLAQHFAQTYRSGHVLNFLLGAIAVLLALTGLLVHDLKLALTLGELGAIIAFVLNTQIGTRHGWHRRWLDYRQLAERLRPMRSLKLLGAAAPDIAAQGRQRWTDWYAAGIWRQSGLPDGRFAADPAPLAAFLVAEEIAPQIAYHRANAREMHRLDHALHRLGLLLFGLSIASCCLFVAGYFAAHDWVAAHGPQFVFASAGLPALGGAIFGIRTQGDFGGSAERSAATAAKLEEVRAALAAPGLGFGAAVDLFEAAARVMLGDLEEWRRAYQHHRLELG